MSEQRIPLVAHPDPTCAWCWKSAFPGRNFPVGVSSNICRQHAEWMAREAGLRRQQQAQQKQAGERHG